MNAWAFSEPFTPRGVAAFAHVKWKWLLLAQFLFASVAAVVMAWVVHNGCFPTVQTAIESLPADGEISSGRLNWAGAPQMLAEGRILAFDVDPDHTGQLQSTRADFQVEFGRDSVRVISLFGYAELFYPPNEIVEFNQTQLEPLWEAWRAVVLLGIAAGALVLLLLTWWILAAVYFLPVWLIGFFTNRDLSLRMSWKLSSAALLPAALVMTLGVLCYGLGLFGLVTLLFIFGAHLVLQWLYLFFGLIFFQRISTAPPKGNPFKPPAKP